MTTWFTSDEHYDHARIIDYSARPFRDLEHMQQELTARHNAVVQPGDLVYHLGDFCLDERHVLTFLKPLTGRHVLIAGNHDKCHPCHRKHEKERRRYLMCGFESVHTQLVFPELDVLLCHLPYVGDTSHEPRYPEHRPKDDGKFLLHGHVHEAWRVRDRMINVGVDVWDYAPVSLETIRATIGRCKEATDHEKALAASRAEARTEAIRYGNSVGEIDCSRCKGRGSNLEPSLHEWVGGKILVSCASCHGTGKETRAR